MSYPLGCCLRRCINGLSHHHGGEQRVRGGSEAYLAIRRGILAASFFFDGRVPLCLRLVFLARLYNSVRIQATAGQDIDRSGFLALVGKVGLYTRYLPSDK